MEEINLAGRPGMNSASSPIAGGFGGDLLASG